MHFADGTPPGDTPARDLAIQRALRQEMESWEPGASLGWPAFAALAGAAPNRGRLLAASVAAALLLMVVIAVAGIAAGGHGLPAGLDQVRSRLAP